MTEDKKGLNPLATGVVGAVIGAAAAAAAIALSDEKNRAKAEKVLGDLEKQGGTIFKQISKMAMEIKDRGTKVLPKAKKTTKKKR